MKSPSEILGMAKDGRDPHIEKNDPASLDDMLDKWAADDPGGFDRSFNEVFGKSTDDKTDPFKAYKSDPETYQLAVDTYGDDQHEK